MSGEVCVVTGATSGIGKAAAAALAGLGAQVVLVGRDILFTRRLEGSGVTANCAHPGVVRTRFGREARLPNLGLSGQALARWRAPDGRELSGLLTTVTAPGIWAAAPGTRVQVWVTSSGEPTTPPPSRALMIFNAVLFAFWAAGAAGVALLCCYRLCRRALDRRRLAAWESAWALTGPRWTSRR